MVENLRDEQRDAMLRFLLHRMGPEVRGKLMAEMPLAYAALYPTAREAVVEHVAAALNPRDCRYCGRSIPLGARAACTEAPVSVYFHAA